MVVNNIKNIPLMVFFLFLQLSYPGVELKSMKIVKESGPTTTLETFWRMIRMDNLYMRDKLTPEYDIPFHIDREDFKYEFTVR